MKKTNTKAFNESFKAYLLPVIMQKAADYEATPSNPWQWVIEQARNEVPQEFRHGTQAGLAYWLSGCAINIPFYNGEIVKTAERLHGCTLNDKQAQLVIENWFTFHAAKIIQYAK